MLSEIASSCCFVLFAHNITFEECFAVCVIFVEIEATPFTVAQNKKTNACWKMFTLFLYGLYFYMLLYIFIFYYISYVFQILSFQFSCSLFVCFFFEDNTKEAITTKSLKSHRGVHCRMFKRYIHMKVNVTYGQTGTQNKNFFRYLVFVCYGFFFFIYFACQRIVGSESTGYVS